MSAWKILEQIAGALLMIAVLVDVFLTVLYARIGTGILSIRLAHATWTAFLMVARRLRHRGKILAMCGPIILVLLVFMWGLGLALGAALILQPHLGSSIRASVGNTRTDFISALFAGGSSISVVGAANYTPQTGKLRFFYLFNSLVGISVLSLTLTYLMQIYTALQTRNSLALAVDISTERTGDAATLVAHLGAQGHFDSGYSTLANLAESLVKLKEAHYFYPVLFYFRFNEAFYSVSRLTNVTLDAISIIRTALDCEEYCWFLDSGAVKEVWDASFLLLVTLQRAFVPGGVPDIERPDGETRRRWRERFFKAVARLQAANIHVSRNLDAAANSYIELRSEWSAHVSNLAPWMLYSMEDIDPIGTQPLSTEQPRRAA